MRYRAIFSIFIALILFGTGCIPSKSLSVPVPEPAYWPTSGWQASTPEAQGMDSGILAKMLEDISANKTGINSVLVIRNGYLVTEAYFHPYVRDTKVHVQSVTKSIIGALVGKAIDSGYIKDEDETLLSFYPDRVFANPGRQKNAIQLKHLLSMSSGLDCEEFSSSGPSMEQTQGWIQFMLDLPVVKSPRRYFGYCNGNAHLLSAIVEKTTGANTREFANQELFLPLGIPTVTEADWGADPQGFTTGGFGLHLRPVDLARFAFLYLNNGKWEDRQLLPARWVADSTTQHVQKEDGSAYGYLWTIYPEDGHYAALGLGGQQIHVYPSRNLIVVVTAGLESFAEAPEIEKALNEYILPAIKSEGVLAENSIGVVRLQTAIDIAANPVQPVPQLPVIASNISGSDYMFTDSPLGWQKMRFVFSPDATIASLYLNDSAAIEVGLDNLFRQSQSELFGSILLRGHWADENKFVVDYPYPPWGQPVLGELGRSEFHFKFIGNNVQVSVVSLIFGDEPVVFNGSR